MPECKEARPAVESKRASVNEDKRSISQDKFERGCNTLPVAFAILVVLYALWEVFA